MRAIKGKAHFLFFTIVEHGTTRFLDALITLILIRSLTVDSLGSFMVYQSWVAVLLLLFPTLENILYREYGKLKSSGRLGFEVGVFRQFNRFKIGLALLLAVGCAAIPAVELSFWTRFWAVALAFTLPLSQALYGIYREPLRFELRQGYVALLNFIQKILFLGFIFLVGHQYGGEIGYIAPTLIGLSIMMGLIWAFSARTLIPHAARTSATAGEALPRIREILTDVVLWIHINGAVMAAVQTLDVYFLSHSKTALSEIALYSIALKAANFFQIIPIPLVQVFGVYLARRSEAAGKPIGSKTLWWVTAMFVASALFMGVAGYFTAEPILSFLAKGKFTGDELERARQYFMWQIAGVAIFSICFPIWSYLNNRASIRALTTYVFVPWFVFSLVGYALAARQGVMAAAIFNVPVYAFSTVAVLIYFFVWNAKNRSNA